MEATKEQLLEFASSMRIESYNARANSWRARDNGDMFLAGRELGRHDALFTAARKLRHLVEWGEGAKY